MAGKPKGFWQYRGAGGVGMVRVADEEKGNPCWTCGAKEHVRFVTLGSHRRKADNLNAHLCDECLTILAGLHAKLIFVSPAGGAAAEPGSGVDDAG